MSRVTVNEEERRWFLRPLSTLTYEAALCFFQAARASSSVQFGEIWRTSVEEAKTAVSTNTTEINVSIVAWKNASRWECGRRVSWLHCYAAFFMKSRHHETWKRKIRKYLSSEVWGTHEKFLPPCFPPLNVTTPPKKCKKYGEDLNVPLYHNLLHHPWIDCMMSAAYKLAIWSHNQGQQ